MSRLSRMFTLAERRDMGVANEKAWNPSLWNLLGTGSTSGENVNEYTALTYSAVFCAINLYAGTIGALPLHLYKHVGKRRELVAANRTYQTLCRRPNPYMSPMAFRETLVAHAVSWGNCYAEKVENGKGEIVELWPISPNRVTPKIEGGKLVYEVKVGGDTLVLGRDKILHIPGLGFDGLVGYSMINQGRKVIGLSMALQSFGSLYFENGTHPGIVITHPKTLSQAAHDNLKGSLVESYSGLGQSHRLMLLEEGMQIEKIGIPPDDSQFLESRQHQIAEIARLFNLPPHKLKDLTRSTENNIESEQLSFYTDSLLPWLVRFEQAFDMQLLTENEQFNENLAFKHNVEGILRADSRSRGEFYRQQFNIGGITINDIMEKEDRDPIDHPYADEPFVPVNMVPLSLAGQNIASKGASGSDGNNTKQSKDDGLTKG